VSWNDSRRKLQTSISGRRQRLLHVIGFVIDRNGGLHASAGRADFCYFSFHGFRVSAGSQRYQHICRGCFATCTEATRDRNIHKDVSVRDGRGMTGGSITMIEEGNVLAKFQLVGRLQDPNTFVGTVNLESGPPEWMRDKEKIHDGVQLTFSPDRNAAEIVYTYTGSTSTATGTLKLTQKIAVPKVAPAPAASNRNASSPRQPMLAQVPTGGASAAPDIAAVKQCMASFYPNTCGGPVTVTDMRQVDRRITPTDATVIAEIDFRVENGFAGCSPNAVNCTGTCWDMDPTKVRSQQANTGMLLVPMPNANQENFFLVGQGLRIRKSFEFQKYESGWRCSTKALQPVDGAFYLGSP
jgi:hypothetical protein